jgi:hypothetical protein
MIVDKRSEAIRHWGLVGVSALAWTLIAAVADSDRNWARIQAMPREQRVKLLQKLRRFDLELTTDKRQAVRELDRRIAALEPLQQFQYLAALRRYHNWLKRLPENRQEELLAKQPDERMALVRQLVVQYPIPKADTPQLLQIADVGEYSPFELASIFKIWQAATPAQRAEVERLSQGRERREALFRLGESLAKKIPREIKPKDFEEEYWVNQIKDHSPNMRAVFLLEEMAKKKQELARDESARKKVEVLRKEILRRQAIDFYLTKQPVRSVNSERLGRFVSGFPSWVQSTFDQFPPDEARRRLAFSYRLVFEPPAEVGAVRAPSDSPAGGGSPARSPRASPSRPKPKQGGAPSNPSSSNTPF